MTDESLATRPRRPELQRAFEHLGNLAASLDLSSIADPEQQWLTGVRSQVPQYGSVGPEICLDGVSFTPVSANGVAAEWVVAQGASPARRIVYVHGGAWVAGSPADYRAFSATLARLSGASILMVDYRLAPEHRFPAGLDDCVAAYCYALDHGPDAGKASGGDDRAERIYVAGDSAGGNLAAATCLRLADEGIRMPDRLALIAGTLDNSDFDARVGIDDPVCTQESFIFSTRHYLPADENTKNHFISPAKAPDDLLARFPPTLIQVSTIEALLSDSKTFAASLEKVGVRTNLSLWPELPHVWHGFLGLFPEASEALAEIGDFFRR